MSKLGSNMIISKAFFNISIMYLTYRSFKQQKNDGKYLQVKFKFSVTIFEHIH